MYVCMCVYVYICMYVCVYVCTYMYSVCKVCLSCVAMSEDVFVMYDLTGYSSSKQSQVIPVLHAVV